MKRFTWILMVCFLLTAVLGGCSADAITLFGGDYIMQGEFDEGVDVPTLLLDTELGEFLLSPGDYGSFADYGTYTFDGATLTATSHGNVYTFRVESGVTVVYEGAKTTEFIDIPVGAEFACETDAPPLSGSFAAACVN